MKILPFCSAVIMHGGANTIHEALASALALACLPGFADQLTNSDSVGRNGVGIAFRDALSNVTASSLRAAVLALTDNGEDNRYRIAARTMQPKLKNVGGVPKAADATLQQALTKAARYVGARGCRCKIVFADQWVMRAAMFSISCRNTFSNSR